MKIEKQLFSLSRFTKEVREGDDVLLFNNLIPNPVLKVEYEIWRNFRNFPDSSTRINLFNALRKSHLLVMSPKEDEDFLSSIQRSFAKKFPAEPSILYLMLSEDCNLRCSYCPFSITKPFSQPPMSFDIARQGIDFWKHTINPKDLENPHTVIFYGGEPLLNPEVLTKSLSYLEYLKSQKELPANLKLLLDTNGTLFTPSILALLKRYSVEVTVALDSFSAQNDVYRYDQEGQGTYDTVIQAIKLLQLKQITTYLSISLTPNNLHSLTDSIPGLRQYGIRRIGINILRGFLPSDLQRENAYDVYQQTSSKVLVDLARTFEAEEIYEHQTQRRIKAFRDHNFHQNYCGGFGEHIVIHPNGQIGNCPWAQEYTIGYLQQHRDYSTILDKNFLTSRKTDLPLFNQKCLSCEAISICGGQCVWANDQSAGRNSFCIFSQQMIHSLVMEHKKSIS